MEWVAHCAWPWSLLGQHAEARGHQAQQGEDEDQAHVCDAAHDEAIGHVDVVLRVPLEDGVGEQRDEIHRTVRQVRQGKG